MKKFLSLVMALVMVMSLTVLGASAKDFTDADSITYDEAIDVISTIGVVDGYADGDFRPEATLSRGAASKIICNLILGPAAASNLTATTAPFKDVPANSTFAGYIAYCAKEGIIGGYADGSFQPSGTLTGYAFMKMLLGALGYDSANEGLSGSNWSIQVAKLVQGVGLDGDLEDDFVGSKAVTREEACLYAFNTLKSRTVEYKVPGSTIVVGGVEISQKASNATYRTYDTTVTGTTTDRNDGNISGGGYIEFAEEHFPRLVLNTGDDERDSFGRPGHMWTWKGDKIGSYTDTPDATYEGYVTMADLYDDLSLTSTTKEFAVYIDGAAPKNFYTLGFDSDYEDQGPDWLADLDNEDSAENIYKADMILSIDDNSIADVERIGTGAGCTIEAFKTDRQKVAGTIVVTNTYIGEVVSVNEAEGKHAANVEIAPVGDDYKDATNISGMNKDGNGDNVDTAQGSKFLDGDKYGDTFDTDKFDVGDIVTFNYAYKLDGSKASIKKPVAKAETVEGEVKDYTDQESFTLGSTEYKYSKMATQKVKSEDIRTSIVAYLDKQGNVLYFDEGKDNNKNFALILDAGVRSAVGRNTYEAELLFADGSTKVVSTDKLYGNSNSASHTSPDTCWIGQWVTYRESSNGRYVLTKPSVKPETTVTNMMKPDHTVAALSDGEPLSNCKIGDTSAKAASNVDLNTGNDVRVNSATVIIVKTKSDTFKVYEGVKNLPEITVESGTPKILYSSMTRANQTYAKFLYIDATDTGVDVSNRTNTDLFLVANTNQKLSSDGSNEYYAFKGVVDGTINNRIKLNWNDTKTQAVINDLLGGTNVTLSTFSTEDGLYEVDLADEIMTDGKGVVVASSVDKVTGETIEVDGGDTYDLADGCKFFRVDGTATNHRVTESTWKGISRGDIGVRYDYVALSYNSDFEVTAVYWRMDY